jgi:hypothetical protein
MHSKQIKVQAETQKSQTSVRAVLHDQRHQRTAIQSTILHFQHSTSTPETCVSNLQHHPGTPPPLLPFDIDLCLPTIHQDTALSSPTWPYHHRRMQHCSTPHPRETTMHTSSSRRNHLQPPLSPPTMTTFRLRTVGSDNAPTHQQATSNSTSHAHNQTPCGMRHPAGRNSIPLQATEFMGAQHVTVGIRDW